MKPETIFAIVSICISVVALAFNIRDLHNLNKAEKRMKEILRNLEEQEQ